MFCKYCGQEISDDSVYCSKCGKSINYADNVYGDRYMNNTYTYPDMEPEKKGYSIASLVIGILGLLAWLLPCVGFPVIIVGLVLGIIGHGKGGKAVATAGIILCTITLILTLANSILGAIMGFNGMLSFQQDYTDTLVEKNQISSNEFSLRDEDDNILMQGGIAATEVGTTTDAMSGTISYVVKIYFTDEASDIFAGITEDNIGRSIGIYLNDNMIANPMVTCAITEGTCEIASGYSYEEAKAIAEKLDMTIE